MKKDIYPKIFEYNEPHNFLNDVFKHKKQNTPQFSINAWSTKMGFKHPSSLQFLLNGKRKVKPSHIRKLIKGLDLSINEEDYFDEMVHLNNATDDREKSKLKRRMKRIAKYSQVEFLEQASFELISEWYHFAIAAMTHLTDFRNDPNWISEKLNHRVTPLDVIRAIKRLKQIGLIIEVNGKLKTTNSPRFYNSNKWESDPVIKNQTQCLDLSKEIIKNKIDGVSFSEFITIKKSKTTEAQHIIQEFKAKMSDVMEEEQGDSTVLFAVQFLEVANSKKP